VLADAQPGGHCHHLLAPLRHLLDRFGFEFVCETLSAHGAYRTAH
jgi:hypothetical protein